ncbi:MAG: PEP-CTERM sorting domain-containing protein [Oxalobacteraceae bacterium]|nr:MAG: PEP-CTERM sorting domain-containing protein [Oxalobacteraceae bacterium]
MIKQNYSRSIGFIVAAGAAIAFGAAHASQLNIESAAFRQETTSVEATLDVTGIPDNDERGAESNFVRELMIAPGALIFSLAWDVNLTSNPGSYLSEMQVTFSDSLGNGITFTPGGGDDFDGTLNYTGFQDFRQLGQSFRLEADGILRVEFHDYYKDLAYDEPEGTWNSGTLTFGVSPVPEPTQYAMLLSGLLLTLVAAKRRA